MERERIYHDNARQPGLEGDGAYSDLTASTSGVSHLSQTGMSGGTAIKSNVAANMIIYQRSSLLEDLIAETKLYINMKDCNKHVLTHVEEVAYKHLTEEGCVFIRGRSGSGKTHLGDKLLERASREFSREMVKISSPDEWNFLPKSSHFDARPGLSVSDKYVVMIDDIFGSTKLIQYTVDRWKQKFDLVWPLVQSGKIWIVITSRPEIIFQVKQSLQRYDIIRQSSDVILDEGQYCFKEEEKFEFIDKLCGKYLNSLDRNRIAKTHTALGFPQCCTYFATHKQVQDRGWEFFVKPFEFIKDEINCVMCDQPKTYFVLLMVLAYDGSLPKKIVQTINPPQYFKDRCTQMKRVSGLEEQPLPRKKEFEVLCGVYLTDDGTCFQFSHRSIQDVLCVDLCQSFPDLGTEISTPNMLVEYIRTRGQEEGQTEMVDLVILDEEYHPILSKKLKEYLSNDRSRHIVLSHPSLNDMNILKEIFREWDVTGIKQLAADDQCIFQINRTFNDMKKRPFSEEFDMERVFISDVCRFCLSNIIINGMNEFAKYIVRKLSPDTDDQLILDEALLCAVYESQNDLVEMLLKHGAQPSQTCFEILPASLDLSFSNCSKLTKMINPKMTDMKSLFVFALNTGNVTFLRNITEICTKYMADHKQFYTRYLQMISKIHNQMCDVSCKSVANSSKYKDQREIRLSKAVDAITFLLCAGGTIDLDRIVVLAISQHVPDTMTELLHNHFHIPYSMDNDLQGERGHSKKLHGLLRNVTKARVPVQTETLHALLHRAAWNQCQVCLNIFLSVCDVNVSDEDGNTALHYMAASDVEHCHDVLHILKEKATDGFKVNNEGQSPLHLAAINHCVDCVRLLLPSSDVHAQDNAGNTALHSLYRDVTSSRPCCHKIAELLIGEEADLHAKNKMGQTALHLATRKQCKVCVRKLLTRSDINAQDVDGNTALHSVHDTSLKMIGSCDKHGCHDIYLILVGEGADVHSENKMRQTALHLAVRRQCEEGVRLLVPKSKVNAQDINGNTALHHLSLASLNMVGSHSKEGCDEILQLLLQHEAKVHIANRSGKTALHFAAMRHLGKYVRTLLTCKSDVDAQDEGGNTALHCIHDATLHRRCSGLCSEINQLLIKEGASVHVENKRGETALHLAAGSQCREAVRLLLSRSDVNAQDKDGNTALHRIHVGKGDSCDQNMCHEISQLLITEDADVNIKNRNGEMALHVATRGLCFHGVRVLLVSDVTAKRAKTDVNAKDNDGNTALHCLHHGKHSLCVPSTCYRILKLLIKKDADVQLKNSRGRTPLHMAARLHCADSVKLLVTLLDLNAQDEDGNTALHCLNINTLGLPNKGQTDINTIVCQISHQSEETTTVRPCRKCISMSTTNINQWHDDNNSNLFYVNDEPVGIDDAGPNSDCHDICRLLIEKGSDVQIKNKSGQTALHFAARRQCREGVSMLLGKSDVDTQDEDGNTALHHIHGRTPGSSCRGLCSEICQLLLKAGCIVQRKNKCRQTALHVATRAKCITFVRMLLTVSGMHVNARDKHGRTALHYVCHTTGGPSREDNCYKLNQLFVDKMADAQIKDNMGETALHVASRGQCLECVRLLLHVTDANVKDDEGNTAAHCIHKPSTFTTLEDNCHEILQLLIEKGLDGHIRNNSGQTALHLTASKQCRKGVELLLDVSEVNAEDNTGDTALHYLHSGSFCKDGCDKIYQLLIDRGGDVQLKNKTGMTVLHSAARSLCTKCVRLLRHVLDVNAQDEYGNTAIHYIHFTPSWLKCNCRELYQLLFVKGADGHMKNKKGHTPLHFAARKQCGEGVSLLLPMSDVNWQDNDGNTPLHFYVTFGNRHDDRYRELYQLLTDNGADIHIENGRGETAEQLTKRRQLSYGESTDDQI